jgi:hypothetical protein
VLVRVLGRDGTPIELDDCERQPLAADDACADPVPDRLERELPNVVERAHPRTVARVARRRYLDAMAAKRAPTSRGAGKLGERERALGIDADDEAARWLAANDPEPVPEAPKSLRKSKLLHQWRERQRRGGGPKR